MERVEVIQTDITQLAVDAIVNAANETLLGGGGVDGAIHKAAGPALLAECRTLGGCKTGQCKVTGGYRLPAKWVIHTVGPVWRGGGQQEESLLAHCYRNCLQTASHRGFKTIAFPSIGTGSFRFPLKRASEIARYEIQYFLKKNDVISKVIMACLDGETFKTYRTAFGIE